MADKVTKLAQDIRTTMESLKDWEEGYIYRL
jgi:hypothetical protein